MQRDIRDPSPPIMSYVFRVLQILKASQMPLSIEDQCYVKLCHRMSNIESLKIYFHENKWR